MRRAKDWLAYLAIAIVIVASAGAWGIHRAKTGGAPDLPLKWLALAGLTGIGFGYTIKWFKSAWGRKFWLLIALALAVHACVWAVILLRHQRTPLLLMGLAVGPELVVLLKFLDLFLMGHRPR